MASLMGRCQTPPHPKVIRNRHRPFATPRWLFGDSGGSGKGSGRGGLAQFRELTQHKGEAAVIAHQAPAGGVRAECLGGEAPDGFLAVTPAGFRPVIDGAGMAFDTNARLRADIVAHGAVRNFPVRGWVSVHAVGFSGGGEYQMDSAVLLIQATTSTILEAILSAAGALVPVMAGKRTEARAAA